MPNIPGEEAECKSCGNCSGGLDCWWIPAPRGLFHDAFHTDKKFNIEDLAFSLQETVFAMLTEVSERAIAHTGKTELVLGGGVACNKRLREMCRIMCKERNAKFFVPENQYLIDNGLMIAWLGFLMRKHATKNTKKINIRPYERTDDIKVTWK